MVASAIAYFLTGLFALMGANALYRVSAGSPSVADKEFAYSIAGFVFFGVAWGCAWLGGI